MRGAMVALFLLAAAASTAKAGIIFDFVAVISGSADYTYEGSILIEGAQSRVDIRSGSHPLFNPNYSIISNDGGAKLLILDHAQKTWFVRKTERMSGHLPTGGIGQSRASRPRVHMKQPDADRWTLNADYDLSMVVEGENVDGTITLTADLWLMPGSKQTALPWGLLFATKTGFRKVDDAIADRMPRGVPLKEIVRVTRRFAGGPPKEDLITITTSNATTTKPDATSFAPPPGYRYREPSFVFGDR